MRPIHKRRRGLTLLELLVVLAILIATATIVVPMVGYLGQRSQQVSSVRNLSSLQEILMNQYLADRGELPRPAAHAIEPAGDRKNHPQLCFLLVNPDFHEDADPATMSYDTSGNLLSGRSWRGNYLLHGGAQYEITDSDDSLATGTNFTDRYGETGDPTVWDAWGNPIVIQEPDADDDGTIDEDEAKHARLVSAGEDGILDTDPDLLMPTDAQRDDDLVLFLFRHDEIGTDFLTLER